MHRHAARFAAGAFAALASFAAHAAAPAVGEGGQHLPRPVAEIDRVLAAQDFELRELRPARPAIERDVARRGLLATADGSTLEVKVRPAEPGGASFNNEPRYELAAYRLQALFLDPDEHVVPPTAVRSVPLERWRLVDERARPTVRGTGSVLVVLQAWLQHVTNPPDVLDRERLARDAEYARHVGNLNVFTFLFRHADSNQGNFLVSSSPASARVFAVDNGVALLSDESDRGRAWSELRVDAVAAGTVARLRRLDRGALEAALGVVAQFRIVDGRLVEEAPGPRTRGRRGVRVRDGVVQLGLTDLEIRIVERQIGALLRRVDAGRIALLPALARH